MNWKKILINLVLSSLTFFTGVIGLVITRLVKLNWGGQIWTYVPFFWMPILTSWPISLTILFGGFDI
jgi:hypothetical protein